MSLLGGFWPPPYIPYKVKSARPGWWGWRIRIPRWDSTRCEECDKPQGLVFHDRPIRRPGVGV